MESMGLSKTNQSMVSTVDVEVEDTSHYRRAERHEVYNRTFDEAAEPTGRLERRSQIEADAVGFLGWTMRIFTFLIVVIIFASFYVLVSSGNNSGQASSLTDANGNYIHINATTK